MYKKRSKTEDKTTTITSGQQDLQKIIDLVFFQHKIQTYEVRLGLPIPIGTSGTSLWKFPERP